MKCPNCYNENEHGRSSCKYCGTELPIEEVVEDENIREEEIQSQDIENSNLSNEVKYENIDDNVEKIEVKGKKVKREKSKKTKKVIVLVLIFLILISACAGGIYYYIISTTPDNIYKTAISQIINNTLNSQISNAKSLQVNAKVGLETDTTTELSELNGFTLDTSFGYDINEKEALLQLKLDQGEDSYLATTILSNLNNYSIYIGDDNLYDKLIKVDIPEEYVEQIDTLIDFDKLSVDNTNTNNQISQILINVLNNNLKAENITRESAKITYEGKQKTVKDNVLVLTEGEFKATMTNIIEQLKSNETFLGALGENKETIVYIFDSTIEELSYLSDDENVEVPQKIKIHLYTSGLFHKFAGIKIEGITSEGETQLTAQIIKTGEFTYTTDYIQVVDEQVEQTTTSVTIQPLEDGTTNLDFTFYYNDVPVTLKTNYSISVNQGLKEINTENSVNITELKEEDYDQILSNLEVSPIYTVVYMIMTYIEENDINIDFNTGISGEASLPNNIQLEENQNFVISSDDDIAVFEVPTTFEVEYNGNAYKSFRKNNRIGNRAEVYINVVSGDARENIEEYISDYDYLTEKVIRTEVDEKGNEYEVEEESQYSNVSISDISEQEINGTNYYILNVKYTSGTINNNITYYATQLSDTYSYIVRVEDGSEIISDSEMEKILNITIY